MVTDFCVKCRRESMQGRDVCYSCNQAALSAARKAEAEAVDQLIDAASNSADPIVRYFVRQIEFRRAEVRRLGGET